MKPRFSFWLLLLGLVALCPAGAAFAGGDSSTEEVAPAPRPRARYYYEEEEPAPPPPTVYYYYDVPAPVVVYDVFPRRYYYSGGYRPAYRPFYRYAGGHRFGAVGYGARFHRGGAGPRAHWR